MNTHIAKMLALLIVGSALVSMAGCAAGDRAYEDITSVTDPDKTTLQTRLVWMSPLARIRPVSGDKMVVYCRVKNSAGADVNLRGAVLDEIQNAGYQLTSNIDEAQFVVTADLRHFGEGSQTSATPIVAGAALGAVAGGVIGHNVGSGHTGAGAVVGGLAGAALGDIAAKRNKMREISLIVDVTLGERIAGGVATSLHAEDRTTITHSGGLATSGGYEGGSSAGGSSEAQVVDMREDFLYHRNRVTASAKRMNLQLCQAEPVLKVKLARAVANALP